MIASIGDLVLDITIVPERRLSPNDDTPAAITLGGGGQSANFCAWAAYLGEPVRLVGRIGDDVGGVRLVAALEAEGVEVLVVRAAGELTGAIAVLVGPDGERTMATQRGASIGLRPEDLRSEWFSGVNLLHLPAYSLFRRPLADAARAAVAAVRGDGGLLAIDLSSVSGLIEYGPSRLVSDLEALQPDLLFATAAEVEALKAPIEALAATAVLKLGPAGCQVGSRRITAPHVKVLDPTGAGDAFAAAFCAAFVRGQSAVEAAETAVLVAAEAVAHVGARPAPGTRAAKWLRRS